MGGREAGSILTDWVIKVGKWWDGEGSLDVEYRSTEV